MTAWAFRFDLRRQGSNPNDVRRNKDSSASHRRTGMTRTNNMRKTDQSITELGITGEKRNIIQIEIPEGQDEPQRNNLIVHQKRAQMVTMTLHRAEIPGLEDIGTLGVKGQGHDATQDQEDVVEMIPLTITGHQGLKEGRMNIRGPPREKKREMNQEVPRIVSFSLPSLRVYQILQS